MTEPTLCRLFFCKNERCGKPMLLPLDKLLQLIVDPADPSIRASAIAAICHWCRQIKKYSLDPNSSDRSGEDRLVPLDQTEAMNRLAWLKCGEESCTSRLPLIETSIASTVPELHAANIRDLEWTDLTCPNLHPIPYPQP